MGTFKVAPGKSLISVGELLAWIADTAEPPDERLPTLATLRIQTRIGTNAQGNAHYLEAELTEADWQTLDAAWIDLPPVKDAPEDAWPKYVEALERWKHEHAADAPSWQLAATFINHKQLARDRRMVVFNAHHDFLQKSLNDGSVKALNSLGVPTETLSFDTVLKVDEVRKYLDSVGHELSWLPHFVISARPLEIPTALLSLPNDALVSFQRTYRPHSEGGPVLASDLQQEIQARISRQAQGHFTVNEAAQVLADAGLSFNPVQTVNRFMLAHAKGELPIHQGGSRFRLEVGETVSDSSDTVEVGELDAWLRASAGYGFPVAVVVQPSAAPASAIETPKQRRARLLQMHDDEVSAGRERGALARITEIEKRTRPTADRSNIGKDIRKAREERDAERRGGGLTRLLG